MTHWFLEEESSSTNILLLFSLSYYALTSLSSYIIDHSSWYSCFQLVLSIVIFVIIISNPSPFTGIYPLRCPSLRRLLPYLSPFPSIVGTFLQIYNSKFFWEHSLRDTQNHSSIHFLHVHILAQDF